MVSRSSWSSRMRVSPSRSPITPMCCRPAASCSTGRRRGCAPIRASAMPFSAVSTRPPDSLSAGDLPAHLVGETLEEVHVVGALGRLAHTLVDLLGVLADQDAPAIGLHA